MSKKYTIGVFILSLLLTSATVVLFWIIPHNAELGIITYALGIYIGVPVLGIIAFLVLYLLVIRRQESEQAKLVVFTVLLLVLAPTSLGFIIATAVKSADTAYHSSQAFQDSYRTSHGISAEITERTAEFAQCTLVSYQATITVEVEKERILRFYAEELRSSGLAGNFVEDMRTQLDDTFTRDTSEDAGNLSYVVPAGSHLLTISSRLPFRITLHDNEEIFTIESLSGKSTYPLVFEDTMSYSDFNSLTEETKNLTCHGTPAQTGSYFFANEYVVVHTIPVTDDTSGKNLYLTSPEPDVRIATIVAPGENYTTDIPEGENELYDKVTNSYTGELIPVYTHTEYETIETTSGDTVQQVTYFGYFFPEPIHFEDYDVYLEPLHDNLNYDEVESIIQSIEPSFYESITFSL